MYVHDARLFCLFSVSSGFQVVSTRHTKLLNSIWLIERSECAVPVFTTSGFIFSTVVTEVFIYYS